jgi:hypothetical protein
MDLKLLIDGIVRQTTVLVAQISTSAGSRSPLSHVVDQVFFELASEIEAQGVKRRVAADMFGLALRAYQKKMRRLTESRSERDRTLWEAVLSFVGEAEVTRSRIEERFQHDGPREVAAVLHDLVRGGLVYATGAGEHAVYGVTSEDVRNRVTQSGRLEGLMNVVWLKVFRGEASSVDELCTQLPVSSVETRRAVEELLKIGRLTQGKEGLTSTNVVLPLGAAHGWEAAILDHFRAVAVSIASKLRGGAQGANAQDRVGGSTFTFTLDAQHPHADEVYGLLREQRTRVQALWDRVSAYNAAHPPDEASAARVTFYLGQSVEEPADETAEEDELDDTDRDAPDAREVGSET